MRRFSTMPEPVVGPLEPRQIRLAYPLMRSADPSLELAPWLRYARRAVASSTGRHAGVLVACWPGAAFLSGVACYHRQHDPRHGRVLVVDHCVALDLLSPERVARALLRELDAVAVKLGCRAVQRFVPVGDRILLGSLLATGHSKAGTLVFRSGDPDEPENDPVSALVTGYFAPS